MAFAVVELGLSEEKFWRTTPSILVALIEHKREQIKREDYRSGVITMIVRAIAGGKNAHPFDFFPQHKDTAAPKKAGITSAETVRANMRAFIEGQKIYGEKEEGG